MKKQKYLFTTLLALLVTSFSTAQNNIGIEYFSMGEYESAKQIFEKELSQKPAEANYYLGEIAFAQGKLEDAKTYYAKGLSADPEYPLNKVGEGKLLLKTNKNAAEDAFSAALKKNKKSPEVNVAIARAYFENGLLEDAKAKIEDARKYDKKYPGIYILEGDILFKSNPGEAAGRYEQAIYFDSNYVLGYLKSAKVYESIHPALAVEKLQTVIKLNPDYVLAYKYLGQINTSSGHWEDAIAAYQKYFAASTYNVEDITRYASVLYFAKKYDESIKLLEEGLSKEPDNYVLNRLLMYNLADTQQFEKGLPVADKFFSLSNGKEHIGKDYTTYAILLKEAKQFDKALEQYKKAMEVDKESSEIYAEIADLYRASGDNAQAAEAYKKYIELLGENVEAKNYYQLGYYYLNAATNIDSSKVDAAQIKTLSASYLHSADSAFAIVIERLPESYTGYFYRARVNSLLDPDTELGLARPYYEKLVEVLTKKGDDEGSKDMLLESYKYLGYYFYLKEDKHNAINYWEKILSLSPGDSTAIQVLEQLKGKK